MAIINGTPNPDNLVGTGSSDVIDGLAGADSMAGGLGSDTYTVDDLGDTVTEVLNGGTDTVKSSVSFTLGDHIEYLTLTGIGAINGTGNTLNNWLVGNDSDNILDGKAGNDTMQGKGGNDTYVVDSASDSVSELNNQGTDTVQAYINYTLGSYVEHLTLLGIGHINATGNTLNNILTGNAGNNILTGGTGVDQLFGEAGNDTYVIDNTDTVTEDEDEGIDTVQAGFTYTLGANFENLTLTGSMAINATGNDLDNILTGNSGINTLTGGEGNDTYVIQSATDVIVETGVDDVDTVQSAVTHILGATLENLTLTGTSSINATGNAQNNILIGNTGANILDGLGGDDSMAGGLGGDTYVVDTLGDVVTEILNGGTDLVKSSVSFILGDHLENLTLTGVDPINGTGNALNNILIGNDANNILNGLAGNDSMQGKGGDDTYVVDSISDSVTELINQGTDTVQSHVNYTLGNYVENLTLLGIGNVNATGNTLNNILIGNAGNNTLTGGTSADQLFGEAGNDTYVIDNLDTVTEDLDEGIDTVQAGFTYTLGANFENLTLTGSMAINATGNDLDNILTGNSGINTLTGGEGNDTYVIQSATDVIVETGVDDIDTVQSAVTHILGATLENLTLTGTSSINATGNAQNNILIGNTGANILDGLGGDDSMAGGLGGDTYVVDTLGDVVTEVLNGGTDLVKSSVSFILGDHLENLTLTGVDPINGTGNALNNILIGNDANNILNGLAGNDSMQGKGGDDTYVVDSISDSVTELINQGTDTVQSHVNYTLGNYVENLTLLGIGNVNATGNTLNNILIGNAGNNTLTGGTSADQLFGEAGNDTYVIDNLDTVTEDLDEGIDTVQAGFTYTLGANFENLTLTGSMAINATGNDLDNILTGNSGINTLTGGEGNDTYVIQSATDVIVETGVDDIDTVQSAVTHILGATLENLTLTGTSSINATGNAQNNILIGNTGANILDGLGGDDSMAGGLGGDTYVVDTLGDVVTEVLNGGTDLVKSSVSFILGDHLENLTLTGVDPINGTGNALNNILIGNDANNILNGMAGNDSMQGKGGDDTYVVDSISDSVTELINQGTDTVQSSITYTLGNYVENLTLLGVGNSNATGNTLNNILIGNMGNNTLNGGTGADQLSGEAGNDTYVIDNTDTVTEDEDEGIDTVQAGFTYTLGANVENLTLTGTMAINATGNDLDNILTGNSGTNTLTGGEGNDTYIIQNATDVIVETGVDDIDTVQSNATFILAAGLENLTLTGTSSINATGNGADNILTGNTGANILNGMAGADSMAGGTGSDTYVVDNLGDTVTEVLNGGTDTVQSSVSFVLGDHFENLTLTGTDPINGTGNALNNILIGNDANNTLNGMAGNDSMQGKGGDDTYVVDSASDSVTELINQGTDTVQSSVTYTLGNYVENLTLLGLTNINATGNTLNNILIGNAGINILNGGTGADQMSGGLGDDTYIIDNLDTITEAENEGFDTVQVGFTYTLGANFDILNLTGSSNINGTGNDLDNILAGNSGTNILTGGEGDDLYVIQNATDVVVETGIDDWDGVQANFSYTLGENLEVLALTGSSGINATGNAADNVLSGNTGANILDGKAGADLMGGGSGNDTYIVDNNADIVFEGGNAGTDTVKSEISFRLDINIENLTLTGTQDLSGIGNGLNNILTGNNGKNVLDGAEGNDTMYGGLGDDFYWVDSTGDKVIEYSNQGNDQVHSFITYTMPNYVESLILVGTNAINGTGNSLGNFITGNDANNTLDGGSGDDFIWGLGGFNILKGGSGTDFMVGGDAGNTFDGGAGLDFLIGGFAGDTYLNLTDGDAIFDQGGSDDLINLRTYNWSSTSVDMTAEDLVDASGNLGSDGKVDSLIIYLGSQVVFVVNYFNNTSGSVGSSGAGAGLIETISFKDINLTYDDVYSYVYDDLPLFIEDSTPFSIFAPPPILHPFAYNLVSIGGGTYNDDWLYGTPFADNLSGLGGDDVIYGADNNDFLDGGPGNDYIFGGNGSDILFVGLGQDVLYGEDGDDTYRFGEYSGTDFINDETGLNDVISFYTLNSSSVSSSDWYTLDNDENGFADALLIKDWVVIENYFDNTAAMQEGTGLIESVQFIDGSLSFNEISNMVTPSPFPPPIPPPPPPAPPLLFGQDTYDQYADDGSSESPATATDYSAIYNNAVHVYTGSMGNDVLNSTENVIEIFRSDLGNDTLNGGSSYSLYSFQSANWGQDTITDTGGLDTVSASVGAVMIDLGITTGPHVISGLNTASWSGTMIENASGSIDNDLIYGNNAGNYLYGGDGFGNDYIFGRGGNDILIGFHGNDMLDGGIGDDIFEPGAGNDLLKGGEGNDLYKVRSGDDIDLISDTGGADTVSLNVFINQFTWSALDFVNDGDSFIDSLRIQFSDNHYVTIENYFDNTSLDDDFSGAGSGYVEHIESLSGQYDFSDVQDFLA